MLFINQNAGCGKWPLEHENSWMPSAFAGVMDTPIITDFDADQGDRIALADGQAYTVTADTNGDALIDFGAAGTLTLVGILPTTVSGAWFLAL